MKDPLVQTIMYKMRAIRANDGTMDRAYRSSVYQQARTVLSADWMHLSRDIIYALLRLTVKRTYRPLIDLGKAACKWAKEAKMPAALNSLLERITVDPDVRFGKPCIRGHRITAQEILEWLAGGASQAEHTPPNWRPRPKYLEDEAPLRRRPVQRLVSLLRDLFPESESALRNGFACIGDRKILEYSVAHDFVLFRPTAIFSVP